MHASIAVSMVHAITESVVQCSRLAQIFTHVITMAKKQYSVLYNGKWIDKGNILAIQDFLFQMLTQYCISQLQK